MPDSGRPSRAPAAPFEALGGSARARIFLTCEHAAEALPDGYEWHESDLRWVGTHWAVDLGARELVHDLNAALDAPAMLARFSRLLVDLNRPEDAETLFRPHAEGEPVMLNHRLTPEEREARLDRFYRPYHDALDARLGAHDAPVLFAVHSFTPVYEGNVRPMEVGVLFDREDALADELAFVLRRAGFVTAMNEPYSGKHGLIYAAEKHASAHGRRALEIEVRQDLAVDGGFRRRLVEVLGPFLRGV